MNELRWIIAIGGIVLLAAIYLWGRFSRRQAAAEGPHGVHVPTLNREFDSRPEFEDSPDDEGIDRLAGSSAVFEEYEEPVTETVELDARVETQPGMRHADSSRVEPGLGDIDLAVASNSRVRIEHTLGSVNEFSSSSARDHSVSFDAQSPVNTGTHASSETARPKPRNARKIVTLRLAAPVQQRFAGVQLRELFESQAMEHGKYGIFHRTEAGESVFSAASMVEPGTFDLDTMDQEQYSGITWFMLLPGPLDGVEAFAQMRHCASQVERSLGGTLQDERGIPLNDIRVGTLHEEIVKFQQELHAPQAAAQH